MVDEELGALPADTLVSAAGLSKLRWRCRRGLLENDLFIERFFNQHADALTAGQARGMYALMALADNDLLDILLNRPAKPLSPSDPEAQLLESVMGNPEVTALLPLLRT